MKTQRKPAAAPQEAPGLSGRWLVKQEPETYPWGAFVEDGGASWDGVRNFQARNNLRLMRAGDPVLFYSSGGSKSVVGIAVVSKAAYPDPTADEPGWVSVRLRPARALERPVTLAQIKATPSLSSILLVRNSRLSVMPLPLDAFDTIISMGG